MAETIKGVYVFYLEQGLTILFCEHDREVVINVKEVDVAVATNEAMLPFV
jgi:hypothetical protein